MLFTDEQLKQLAKAFIKDGIIGIATEVGLCADQVADAGMIYEDMTEEQLKSYDITLEQVKQERVEGYSLPQLRIITHLGNQFVNRRMTEEVFLRNLGIYELVNKPQQKYQVIIVETLKRTVTVEAESEDEAVSMVNQQYYDQDIVLDSSDFLNVDIMIPEGDVTVKFLRTFKGEGFRAYEFQTPMEIHVEEADLDCDLFRMDISDNGKTEVFVTSSEGYWIHEDVTHLFDVEDLKRQGAEARIEDEQEAYDKWLETKEDEE